MPTSSTNLIAHYRADAGVSIDSNNGISQWNDLTGNGHHLTQTSAAARPVYTDQHAITFNGNTAFLNLRTSLTLPGTGCAVLMCSRGTGTAIITLGSSFSYGFNNGMVLTDSSVHSFPAQTYLPTLTRIVHGIRCQSAITRLCMGMNQTSDLDYDITPFNTSGGMLGPLFTGDVYELAIFSPAPSDNDLGTAIANLQNYNAIGNSANTIQFIFVGDNNIATCGKVVCELNSDSIKPLVLAQASHTIAQQQTLIDSQLTNLDLSPFNQTIAIVCAGSNDAAAGRTHDQIVADLSTLCTTLRQLQMTVIVATVPDPVLSTVNATLQDTYTAFADALAQWAADARLADSTNTTAAKNGVKAALLQSILLLYLDPPEPLAVLNYANFYSGGKTFAGSFGNFVRS